MQFTCICSNGTSNVKDSLQYGLRVHFFILVFFFFSRLPFCIKAIFTYGSTQIEHEYYGNNNYNNTIIYPRVHQRPFSLSFQLPISRLLIFLQWARNVTRNKCLPTYCPKKNRKKKNFNIKLCYYNNRMNWYKIKTNQFSRKKKKNNNKLVLYTGTCTR